MGEKGFGGGGGRKLGPRLKDWLMSGCAAIGAVEGFFEGVCGDGRQNACSKVLFFFTNSRTKSFAPS